jgi:cell division protein DivIC
MKSPVFYKLLVGVLIVLLAAVGVLTGYLLHNAQLEEEHFRKQEDDLRQQLADVTVKLQKNEEFLQRLQSDPDFADRLARLRLGYAKPDELIFRFDVDPVTGAPLNTNTDALRTPVFDPGNLSTSGNRMNSPAP